MANSKEKDKYYLKHDYNAASDPEIIQMMSVYGFSGYGMYWRLNEALRAEAEFKLKLTGKYVWNGFGEMLKLPADEAKKFIEDCITEFSLYESDSEYFWSNRLLNDMGLLEAKRETARNAGIESAKRRKAFFDQKNREANENSTTVERPLNENPTTVQPFKVSLGKVSLGKVSLGKVILGEVINNSNKEDAPKKIIFDIKKYLKLNYSEFGQSKEFVAAFEQFADQQSENGKALTESRAHLIMARICVKQTSDNMHTLAKLVADCASAGYSDVYTDRLSKPPYSLPEAKIRKGSFDKAKENAINNTDDSLMT